MNCRNFMPYIPSNDEDRTLTMKPIVVMNQSQLQEVLKVDNPIPEITDLEDIDDEI